MGADGEKKRAAGRKTNEHVLLYFADTNRRCRREKHDTQPRPRVALETTDTRRVDVISGGWTVLTGVRRQGPGESVLRAVVRVVRVAVPVAVHDVVSVDVGRGHLSARGGVHHVVGFDVRVPFGGRRR